MGITLARAARRHRRDARGPRIEVLDAGRLVDAAVHRRAPRRPARLRRRQSRTGSMLGHDRAQIFDETTCVVRAVLRWSEFYAHESCGKCTPCREGSFWYVQIHERLERGDGDEQDIETLLDLSDNILGRAFCALGDGATSPVTSSIQYFRDEYIAHFDGKRLPVRSGRLDRVRRSERLMTVTTNPPATGGARTSRRRSDLVTLTIDGFEISVPKGTLLIRAAEFARHPGAAVLRAPAARPGRRLPAVPGRGRGPAQADGVVHDHGHRRHGREDAVHLGRRREGAERRHRTAARQPPARLPGLRQGRRVPAAEPDDDATATPSRASAT